MFNNLIKTTLRNFSKNKLYNSINVIGLTVGIACSIIIFMIVRFETSFDTHHKNADRIYRVVTRSVQFGNENFIAGVSALLPETLKSDFAEFEAVSVVNQNYGSAIINFKDSKEEQKKFKEKYGSFAFVFNDYFKMFEYDWIEGDKNTVFEKPFTVVITKSYAEKYFGNESPIGKVINFDYKSDFTIVGLVNDPLQNTDLTPKLFINSLEIGMPLIHKHWYSVSSAVQCFVMLKENVSPKFIESKFPAIIEKYMPEDLEEGNKKEYILQKLNDVHFDKRFANFDNEPMALSAIYALSIIGIILLLTACINFINLSTAVAVNRSREVGIRKVLGSSRLKIIIQHLSETLFITFLSLVLSIVVTEIALPRFGYFTGIEIYTSSFSILEFGLFYFALLFGVTLLAGFYPSFILSKYNPVDALKSKFTNPSQGKYSMRNILVISQFVISQFLIISTIIISSQMDYFMNADIGLKKDAVIEFEIPIQDKVKFERFKNKIKQLSDIANVSFSNTGSINSNTWGGGYELKDSEEIKKGNTQIKFIDENFIDTYGVKLIAGSGIAEGDSANKYLVNESFMREAGYKNAESIVGKYIDMWGMEAPITGVVKDFNTTSLHNEINPVVMVPHYTRYQMAAIKLNTKSLSETINKIENVYAEVFPEYILEYDFLDDSIKNMYETEIHTSRIMNLFSVIAIIIGCIGLFGLSSFSSLKRTKEIGIRKVLGAGIFDIIKILNLDFVKFVVVGFLIASPIAYFLMKKWLEDLAYKIEITPYYFIIGIVITLFVALMTISFQSIKAALINPAQTLKYE